ncbi:FtsK/SpoIIIE domain-containing protein [Streptomyces hypolithicus]
MQIRLTVLAPRSGQSARGARDTHGAHGARGDSAGPPAPPGAGAAPGRVCDVLVTAPAGTALAAVVSGLAAAVSGPGSGQETTGAVVVHAGRERLDPQRCALGEPPLVDGAVLSLYAPAPGSEAEAGTGSGESPAQLHVVAGPDAGGVHLLHGGQVRIGRSSDADVPLDDPDVSRLHCAVTLAEDGGVTVVDLGSTNGTALDGEDLTERPVRLAPGALLRLGESALRLTAGERPPTLPTAPDGEGHLRVTRRTAPDAQAPASTAPYLSPRAAAPPAGRRVSGRATPAAHAPTPPARPGPYDPPRTAAGSATAAYGSGPADDASHHPHGAEAASPGSAHPGAGPADSGHGDPVGSGQPGPRAARGVTEEGRADLGRTEDGPADLGHAEDGRAEGHGVPPRRRGGIGAWARRLAGGRGEAVEEYAPAEATPVGRPPADATRYAPRPSGAPVPDAWPDPAALLLTALGPGPRLWERAPDHPEALVLRLGTADRTAPGGGRPLPAVPVTVGLREVGSLGLAGPRARLAGLARSAVAQLTALHSPTDLEIVLISTDRSRALEERTAEWAWLGWLPHLRPAHGQDCRLLLAYDRDQGAARIAELMRRMDEELHGDNGDTYGDTRRGPTPGTHDGPHTVVVVDGDPGSAALRDATARLARRGAAAGIHLLCLAETAAASPLSPVTATYEAACAVSPAFRECGAAALLSGDVATALRLLRTAGGEPAGHGTLATVDAVSGAWAERFARALAPLRTDAHSTGSHSTSGAAGRPGTGRTARAGRATALPPSTRLLDELGLARATPASLLARWAAADDAGQAPGATRAWAVLGAGPHGPLCVDLAAEGPHLLIEGPPGSGRTELLRSVAASLAAAARPDRLGLVLVDGAGGERSEGLRACTELPHVSTHLVASDPLRMREFAQALGAELKRRHELLGSLGFAQWHTHREVSGRLINQRPPTAAEQRGDLDPHPSGTLRLRTTDRTNDSRHRQARPDTEPSPLPRLVVLVDDLDALVAPSLGSTGRPAAGSVVRALEAVAREGERLGVHLVATSGRPDRTADTELARGARLRVALDAPPSAPDPEEPAPGRGRLRHADGVDTPFQGGRVTGRIPRTATLRPTVVPLEWERMGDPPARRPVRELGNGPTDLALLASALDRAARTVDATQSLPPLGIPRNV